MDDASKAVAYKTSCTKCGSNDNYAVYRDGHGHCYTPGCKAWNPAGEPIGQQASTTTHLKPRIKMDKSAFLEGKPLELKSRGLTVETTRRWGYLCGKKGDGTPVQIAQHFDEHGNVVVQKLRTPDKQFPIIGDADKLTLYGMHLFVPNPKQDIVLVEGEIDGMTVDQAFSGTQPVGSIPNGAAGAAKFVKRYAEYLNGFRSVIFCFDMDDAGRKATEACVGLVAPGKARVAVLQKKDANDMLVNDQADDLRNAIKNAKQWRPDGIINGDDIELDMLYEAPNLGYSTGYPGLDEIVRGFRKGELVLVTAGTGIGKSTIVREIGYHFNVHHGLSTGNIFLEESYKKTVQGYIAIDRNIKLGDLRQNPDMLRREDAEESMLKVIKNGRTYFYNHFGSLEADNLLQKIDYLASLGVDFIWLDHISIAISGQTSSKEGERKDIDILMTKLRSAIERHGIGVVAICHLNKTDKGASHEEGGKVSLDDLRGSGTLKQIPDTIIALERDQQGDNPNEAFIRVLKNREFGDLGVCQRVEYDKETGRLKPTELKPVGGDVFDEPKAAAPKDSKQKKLGLRGGLAADDPRLLAYQNRKAVTVKPDDDPDADIPF